MLDRFAREYSYCAYCPKLCRHVCPVALAEHREAVTPHAKMAMADLVRREVVPLTREYSSVFYACVGCGRCTEFCEHDVDVAGALFAARAEAVDHGAQPTPLDRLVDRFYQRNEDLLRKLHRLVDEHYFLEEAHVAYFPGCDLLDYAPHLVEMSLELFEAAGADYVAIMESDLVCGGYPLWSAGYQAEFRHVAERQTQVLNRYKKVVVACPACSYLFRNVYPELGLEVTSEVVHVTEFLESLLPTLKIGRKMPPAYYHDPCYLGRHQGIYDAPRKLLGLAVERVAEFSDNREEAACCGAGGLVPEVLNAASAAMARTRLKEPREAGAELVVSACSSCVRQLGKHGTNVKVLDLVEVLHQALVREDPTTLDRG